MVMRVGKSLVISISLALLGVVLAPRSATAAGRVSVSPTPVSLQEGQQQTYTVTLTEPIISISGTPYVTLNIAINDPSRLTSDVSSVTWSASQWAQPKSFTLTAVDDSIVNGDVNDIVDLSIDSNSEFYDGFAPTFTANVPDNDVTAPSTAGDQPSVLPSVGDGWPSVAALLLALSGGILAIGLHARAKIDV